jgi:hypothetical protein
MHLYWRIQADLDEIGSLLILRHPNLAREFARWIRRNASGLAVSENLTWNTLQRLCLMPN